MPPPLEYLSYLVGDAERLRAAVRADWSILKTGSVDTAVQRGRLLAGDPSAVTEARDLLRSHRRASRKWWILEGETHVDCVLQHQDVTIFIEGKRTEPHLTGGVLWDLQRHQVFRNLDALRAWNARGSHFFVLLAVEAANAAVLAEAQGLDSEEGCAIARASWPHLTAAEAKDLYARYLGFVTWEDIASRFGVELPDTVDIARSRGFLK